MHPGEPTEESRLAFEGRLFDVRVDTVRLANGRRTIREIVVTPDSVSVVPVDEDGNVYLVRSVALIRHRPWGAPGWSRALREAVQRSTRQPHVVAVGPVYRREPFRNTPSFGRNSWSV